LIRFAREYGAPPIVQQPAAQLESTDLKQTPRSHKGWSTFWFPRLKGHGRIESRNKILLRLLLTRQNLATQILELGKPFINGDKLEIGSKRKGCKVGIIPMVARKSPHLN
jgi:hypothetical protein